MSVDADTSSAHAEGVDRETFTLPIDPASADGMAGELGQLATAAEWKRAAIVYARVQVQDGPGRPSGETVNSDRLSPEQYARRGIHGLRSKNTVRAYWRAWDNAITEGLAQPVALGDSVELPDAEWGDCYQPSSLPTTPPYYVPEPSPGQTDQDGELDYFLGANAPNDRDHLGLGQCPPRASDVDEGEPGSATPPQRRNGGARGPMSDMRRLSAAESLIEGIDFHGGSRTELQRQICSKIAELRALLSEEESTPDEEAA